MSNPANLRVMEPFVTENMTPVQMPLPQIAQLRWPNVGPPLGHRWQPPVGQRHFGRWANVGPTVACHCWATGGPTLGHRRGPAVGPPLAATGGPTSFWPVGQRWPKSGMLVGPTVACHCWATGGPTLGHRRGPAVGPPLAATGGPTSFWPVGQRWPKSGMLVGPPVGHRWANISATVGPMINSDKCSTVFKTLFTNSSQTQTKSSPNHNRCRCHCHCALVLASSLQIENRHSAFCTHHFVGQILYK